MNNISDYLYIKMPKYNYSRDGVEVIVIPLAKMPEDMQEREKALGEWVWE